MKRKLRLVIFISGGGTNMEAIAKNALAGRIDAEVAAVVSNEPGAGGLARAEKLGIPTLVLDHRARPDRETHERAIIQALEPFDVKLIVLAGYLRMVTPVLLDYYYDYGRDLPGVINIHPADTRAYQGTHGYEFAMGLAGPGERLTETRITVHFVDAGMDTGPIIRQRSVPVHEDDTLDTLRARGLNLEYELYSEVVQLLAEDRVRLEGGRVIIR